MTMLHAVCLAAAFLSISAVSHDGEDSRAVGELDASNRDDFWKVKFVPSWNRTKRDKYKFHGGLESLLRRLESLGNDSALVNNSTVADGASELNATNLFNIHDEEDRCQKWLDNREKIEQVFPGSINNLPGCPCLYPNDVFYEDKIWDKKRQAEFRWRDASSQSNRLNVYKRGARYCVRSLPIQGSVAAQHCCYDDNSKLLTRGFGAGTPYVVSPDVSSLLNDKIDLVPWRLCKGDFTRYNKVRIPNNENECKENPDDEEYQLQVEDAQDY